MQFGSRLIVVDVRDEDAFKAGHVRSAIHIPLDAVAGRALIDVEESLPARFKQRRSDLVYVYDEVSCSRLVYDAFCDALAFACLSTRSLWMC